MKSRPPANLMPLFAFRSSGGFTLIELMLVLLVMGTFATMVVPSVATSLRSNSVEATTSKVHELLNFACLSAISRHKPVVLNIDSERRRCWVTVRATSLPWIEYEEEKPESRTLAVMEVPEGTSIVITRAESPSFAAASSGTWETIVFQSDGSAEDAIIELTDQRGEPREIQVIGSTGEAIIQKEDVT